MNSSLKGRNIPVGTLSVVERLELEICLMDAEDEYTRGLFDKSLIRFNSLLKKVSKDEALAVIDDYLSVKELSSRVKKVLEEARSQIEK